MIGIVHMMNSLWKMPRMKYPLTSTRCVLQGGSRPPYPKKVRDLFTRTHCGRLRAKSALGNSMYSRTDYIFPLKFVFHF